jgi:hypothetical protein
MKTVAIVCGTVLAIAVIAAITSVQLVGGDASVLIRNLGLVATFLVLNVPILINQIKAKEKAEIVAKQTDLVVKQTEEISRHVNGELQTTVHNAVASGVVEAASQAAQVLKEGQAGNGTV